MASSTSSGISTAVKPSHWVYRLRAVGRCMTEGKSRAKAGRGAAASLPFTVRLRRLQGFTARRTPLSERHFDHCPAKVDLVAGLHAHAPAVVGADVDGL